MDEMMGLFAFTVHDGSIEAGSMVVKDQQSASPDISITTEHAKLVVDGHESYAGDAGFCIAGVLVAPVLAGDMVVNIADGAVQAGMGHRATAERRRKTPLERTTIHGIGKRYENHDFCAWLSNLAYTTTAAVSEGGLRVQDKVRARRRGKLAYDSGTVVSDHGNGTYDVLFGNEPGHITEKLRKEAAEGNIEENMLKHEIRKKAVNDASLASTHRAYQSGRDAPAEAIPPAQRLVEALGCQWEAGVAGRCSENTIQETRIRYVNFLNGNESEVRPAAAVVVKDSCLFVVWRGTASVTDLIVDIHATANTSLWWQEYCGDIKVHRNERHARA